MRLAVEDVTVELDAKTIIADVALAIEAGEFVGLVGPNGSGKSTLLRTIYRALRPVLGAVRVGDDDVWKLSARESARRTAVVVQEGTGDFDFELYVARAIAQESRVLVLDEPTNHLDIRFQLELLDLVRGLGVTTIAAMHDLSLAAGHCDRLYVLEHGSVVAAGLSAQVLTADLVARVFGVRLRDWTDPETGRTHLNRPASYAGRGGGTNDAGCVMTGEVACGS
ncbi:MAG: ABC transporter ATP-binding protein [Pseudonocardiaceae bacterium]